MTPPAPLVISKLQSDMMSMIQTSITIEDKVCSEPDVECQSSHFVSVYFIMQEFGKAIEDYTKSTELDPTFIFTHVQHAVAQYKQGSIATSMAAFRRILKQFPDRGEPSNY